MRVVSNTQYIIYQELFLSYKTWYGKLKIIQYRKYETHVFQVYRDNFRVLGMCEFLAIIPYFSVNIVDKTNDEN